MSEEGRLMLVLAADAPAPERADARPTDRLALDVAALHRTVLGSRVGSFAPEREQDLRWESALLVAGVYVAAGVDVQLTGEVATEDRSALVHRARELLGRVEVVGADFVHTPD